ncbi:Lrp/AsnC family transcriptional regulator [Amycolatopsis sp. NPDC089917]|uniref:Lrp/AsnC family transcriptional regulator n=1 Tax=Amycolatopsis sp. NPDC089917 TaxID=3155187 RepID=UPI003414A74A
MDPLDLRVVGALQVDGRASWRRIAEVLGAPERTVARRGARLLENGTVTVIAVTPHGVPMLVRARSRPGLARTAGTALARRPETSFCYLLTGQAEVVAEVRCSRERLAVYVSEELAATPGLHEVTADPITRYHRTVHEWQPGILTPEEAAALAGPPRPTPRPRSPDGDVLTAEERALVRALREDGRRTHEELARLAGVSESTVRRRVESLRRSGKMYIRAVVEPAVLGLPIEALLWIRSRPSDVDELGRELLASPYVRYAAATMGEHQMMADVTLPDVEALHRFVAGSAWSRLAVSVHTGLVTKGLKRSSVLTPELRD